MSWQNHRVAVRCFSLAMKFASWLQSLSGLLTPPPFRLVQLGSAFWQSRALYVAARLDIATAIGDGAVPVETVAARVEADSEALYRLLRLLAALGIFSETAPRVFANNRLSTPLRDGHPQNVRAMILLHNAEPMRQPWDALEAGIKTGGTPFQLCHGQDFVAYLDSHAEFDQLFAQAMDCMEALVGNSFAVDFAWERFGRVIDVGGSKGGKAVAILKQHPQLKALVVDRAAVIAKAAHYWAERESAQVLERMEFQAGDLFQALPAAESDKDIYLISAVLHGFDDEQCLAALRYLKTRTGNGARAAIMEWVMADRRSDIAGAAFDMQMLAIAGGKERTLAQWHSLFQRSGWHFLQVVNLRSLAKILVISPTRI